MLDIVTGRSLQLHVGLRDRGYNHKHDDDDNDDDDDGIDNDSMEINSSCRCWTSLLGAVCSFMLVCMTEVTTINMMMMMMMIMMMMIMIMTLIMTAWRSTPPAGAGRRYWALSAASCWSA